jgi:hypothetical protein
MAEPEREITNGEHAMGIKREPQVRKSGNAASSRGAAPKPAADANERNGSAPPIEQVGEGRTTSVDGAGTSARRRRKPFVL